MHPSLRRILFLAAVSLAALAAPSTGAPGAQVKPNSSGGTPPIGSVGDLLGASQKGPRYAPGVMTSPPPGSTLPGDTVTFVWTSGVGVSEYWLRIGSTVHGGDIYNQSTGLSTSATVSGIPTDGRPIYVRLSSRINNHWARGFYQYTAFRAPDPDPTPTPGPTPTPPPPGTRYFPDQAVWYQDISNAPLDPESSQVIAYLSRVGWGTGTMRIDFSLEVLHTDGSAPFRTFERTDAFYEPDCDYTPVPVPPGGALEGESGYECVSDGDCHLIVADWSRMRLFEMWRADIRGDVFNGGCLAVWDMTRVYPDNGRGEQCTSADAAGYPIAPLLFNADEVAAGRIDHAIRFILPNASIRAGYYVHPATHAGGPRGPADAPPYGARLRLRADYPLGTLSPAAQVVARAMQRYGMLLADGGLITLTAQSDRFTTAKWSGLLGPYDLSQLTPADFQMVDGGARIPLTYDCVRNP